MVRERKRISSCGTGSGRKRKTKKKLLLFLPGRINPSNQLHLLCWLLLSLPSSSSLFPSLIHYVYLGEKKKMFTAKEFILKKKTRQKTKKKKKKKKREPGEKEEEEKKPNIGTGETHFSLETRVKNWRREDSDEGFSQFTSFHSNTPARQKHKRRLNTHMQLLLFFQLSFLSLIFIPLFYHAFLFNKVLLFFLVCQKKSSSFRRRKEKKKKELYGYILLLCMSLKGRRKSLQRHSLHTHFCSRRKKPQTHIALANLSLYPGTLESTHDEQEGKTSL